MPTFGAWEYEVLEHTFEVADFLSLHMYYENPHNDVQEFFANIEMMDRFIKEAVAVCDAVAAKRRSPKRIMLSFDEWNVWYKARTEEARPKPGWPIAPRLIEEVYDLQDALMVGGALITLLNNSDRVKVACLAQLVNVIGPIFDGTGRSGLAADDLSSLQTRHPARSWQRPADQGPVDAVRNKNGGNHGSLVASAVHDADQRKVVFFVLNREASGR